MKTFDELFDDFFNENHEENNKIIPDKIIDLLHNFNIMDNISSDMESTIDASIGEPDKIEFYQKGKLFYEKRSWTTKHGTITKIIISDKPPEKTEELSEILSDAELLEIAIETEDYETAATLRDKIKKENRKNKKK